MIGSPIKLNSEAEYQLAVANGFRPLFDHRFFVNYETRVKVIAEIFPKYNPKANVRFYHWYWDNFKGTHRCEECANELHSYAARFVSHIITRGSAQHIAYDPMNINLLCLGHHQQWEDYTRRQTMHIYQRNLQAIDWLYTHYGK